LLTAYVLENCAPRPLKRLYDRRDEMMHALSVAAEAARLRDGRG
jgi:deoxyhypusine synthase